MHKTWLRWSPASLILLSLLCLLSSAWAQAPEPAVRVLVAYDSETGHTEKMARGMAEGARQVAGAEVRIRRIEEVTREEIVAADAIALGSPVHMGDVSASMRTALIRWGREYRLFRGRELMNKVGAVFATGGYPSHGKEFTMMSMALTMLQFGMVVLSPYGGLGASATTEFPETDKGVGERELTEARQLGERMTRIALKMKESP